MTPNVSANARAILLLTQPLVVDPRRAARLSDPKPLSLGEYGRVAQRLHKVSAEPQDLLGTNAAELLSSLDDTFDVERLMRLLDRGLVLAQAADRWRARSIWVVSRADEGYPQRLKDVLRQKAPAVLYGCGEPALLDQPGLAIVGSRNADADAQAYARTVASLCVKVGRVVVSGGARGVDRAAMGGALECGGRAVGVLADGLERTSMNRACRNRLADGRLLLVTPYDPQSRFQVWQAMARNKLIYALADAGLVIDATRNKGGTWAGAQEQLDVYRRPVFVLGRRHAIGGTRGLAGPRALDRGPTIWTKRSWTACSWTRMSRPTGRKRTALRLRHRVCSTKSHGSAA